MNDKVGVPNLGPGVVGASVFSGGLPATRFKKPRRRHVLLEHRRMSAFRKTSTSNGRAAHRRFGPTASRSSQLPTTAGAAWVQSVAPQAEVGTIPN